MQVYDKANLGDAMEVDGEEDASGTEEAAQLPGPEEMEEDAEEEEAEARGRGAGAGADSGRCRVRG